MEFTEFDSNGRFGLSQTPDRFQPRNGGALGQGGEVRLSVFTSAEARTYYIQARTAENSLRHKDYELDCLRAALKECVTPTGRIRRKKLLDLISKL